MGNREDFKDLKRIVVDGLKVITAHNEGFEREFANELGDEIGIAYGNTADLKNKTMTLKIEYIIDTWQQMLGTEATIESMIDCLKRIKATAVAQELRHCFRV